MPAEGGYPDRSGHRRDFSPRQGQQNKRMRGRNRKGPNPLTRSYESNGPDVKVRGTALHIAEKYVQLARDAQSSGDRIAAESYLQHAEHYYRIIAAAQAQMPPQQQVIRTDGEGADGDDEDDQESREGNGFGQPFQQGGQPSFGLADPQPYVNGQGQAEDDAPPTAQPADENQQQQNEARDQGERGERPPRGDYRSRRRRQYRDRFNAEGGEGQAAPPRGPVEAPPGDD